jgi:hypothetical protein
LQPDFILKVNILTIMCIKGSIYDNFQNRQVVFSTDKSIRIKKYDVVVPAYDVVVPTYNFGENKYSININNNKSHECKKI